MASESTQLQAADDFPWLELDRVMVKGRQQAVTIYTPLGASAPGGAPPEWARMLAAYRAQDWDRAAHWLAAAAGLLPTLGVLQALYAERIAEARKSPPGPAWDGATRFDSK